MVLNLKTAKALGLTVPQSDQKIREDMVSPSPTSSFVYLEFFT
jgi:hypothetical protein